ncbi:MAG TPA: protoporphyrinogen oxidase [Gemmataceae bacterium]|nr:protoporphyrinogen oxidase [Gemmataceae bacterium]
MPRVVIVGGGISGLALAYRLEQRMPDTDVIVVEERSRLGGSIGTERHEGFQIEIGPNGFLDNKPFTLALCRELGLGDHLLVASDAARRNRYLFLDGRLRLLPNSLLSLLSTDALSWRTRFLLLAERFRPRRRSNGDESIDAFVRRRVGPEMAETLADAFVTGIYAGDPKLMSVQAAFPRLAALERDHGSVLRGMARSARQRRAEAAARGEPPSSGRMWSFREGLGLLIDRLRERLHSPPLTGVTVRTVRRLTDNGWRVQSDGRDGWDAEAVVLACPAYQQAVILADEDADLAASIDGIPYNRVAVVALGYRAAEVPGSLEGFGYLSPQRQRHDVLGVQWCSSIYPDRTPPGMVLLRAMCGGWNRPQMLDWDDARLVGAVRDDLRRAMGIRVPPIFQHIIRWPRAIPQYHLGHLDRVAWIEARLSRHPGLFLGGNAYRGVALNDCVEQGDALAEQVVRYLSAESDVPSKL